MKLMIHLHGHSHYSLLQGLGDPGSILSKAQELNMNSIAITDIGSMYGAIEFYQKAKKLGIKAIIGVELSFVSDINHKENNENNGNIVLICQNFAGYENLLKIVSIANLDGFYEKARIDLINIENNNKGLIGLMGGVNSKIGQMILNNENTKKIEEYIILMKKTFDDMFFLEIISQNESKNSNLKKINHEIIKLSKSTNTKLTIGNEYNYINKKDKKAFEALMCIRDGSNLNLEKDIIPSDYHILSQEETFDIMDKNGYEKTFVQELINNNNLVNDMIDIKIPLGNILFPNYESPDDIKKIYQQIKEDLIQE